MKIDWGKRQPLTTTHPVDTTPGDTFGGLGVDGLTEYHEEEIPRVVQEIRSGYDWNFIRTIKRRQRLAHGGR